MTTLLILLCQAFDLGTSPGERLPTLAELEWSPPHAAEEKIGVEAFAVWTRWDPGLRIDDGFGFGADVKVGLDWGTPASLGFRMGYAGWDTDNDDQQTFPGRTRVGQYRFGFGGDFSSKHFDFSIYANSGLYHFHTRHVENDTKFFFEFEGSIKFKPVPYLKLGLVAMMTCTSTDFNRASSHLFTNHSIGPAVEITLMF
jgi:hypothetical protein